MRSDNFRHTGTIKQSKKTTPSASSLHSKNQALAGQRQNTKSHRPDKTRFLVHAAVIAAVYTVLTVLFAPISFGETQIRLSECLTILPVFTPAAVPGLFLGCLLANLLGGALLPDILFGSLATLLGALGSRFLRKYPLFSPASPILCNTVIIPLILQHCYGIALPLPLLMLQIGLGELASCGLLGLLLYSLLKTNGRHLFS